MTQLVSQELLTLYQLDTTMLPGGQWFYFNSAEDFDTQIIWGGQLYVPIPMQATGFEMTTRGTIPQPGVTISNIYGAGNVLLDTYKGLLGAQLVRILTLRRFLDDGDTPDPAAYITREKFTVAQKTSHNAVAISFKLTSHMDQEGLMLPRRIIARDYCSHVYRIYNPATGGYDYSKATCPYTGEAKFNVDDVQVGQPDQDQCSRTIRGCMARFGNGPLPAYFFPAVGRVK